MSRRARPDALSATVVTVEPRGAAALDMLDIGRARVVATVRTGAVPETGACVSLSLDSTRAEFCDAQTERHLLFTAPDPDTLIQAAE